MARLETELAEKDGVQKNSDSAISPYLERKLKKFGDELERTNEVLRENQSEIESLRMEVLQRNEEIIQKDILLRKVDSEKFERNKINKYKIKK